MIENKFSDFFRSPWGILLTILIIIIIAISVFWFVRLTFGTLLEPQEYYFGD